MEHSPTTRTPQQNSQFQAYQRNQIMGMSPMDLVIKVYDVAILGCNTQDADKVSKALIELISALRFDSDEEIATGLFQLYQYCMDMAKQSKFEEAKAILIDLRDAWLSIGGKQKPAAASNVSRTV